jgi:hypothetical protein
MRLAGWMNKWMDEWMDPVKIVKTSKHKKMLNFSNFHSSVRANLKLPKMFSGWMD